MKDHQKAKEKKKKDKGKRKRANAEKEKVQKDYDGNSYGNKDNKIINDDFFEKKKKIKEPKKTNTNVTTKMKIDDNDDGVVKKRSVVVDTDDRINDNNNNLDINTNTISNNRSFDASTNFTNNDSNYHYNPKGKKKDKKKRSKNLHRSSQHLSPKINSGMVVDHPFEVDDSDHCETPLKAYQDLEVVLDHLLLLVEDEVNADVNAVVNDDDDKKEKKKRRQRSELRIYDPYYCDGGVNHKLSSMGFTNVINNNRDFYKDIETNSIPEYDVLITNPPYSGKHIEKLLQYIVSMTSSSASSSTSGNNDNKNRDRNKNKPCFLLLPHFVYTKDYYERTISRNGRNNSSFYFLIPEIRYQYVPPDWVNRRWGSKALAKGKETTAPFPSFWYCHTPSSTLTSTTTTTISSSTNNDNNNIVTPHWWLEKTFGTSGQIRSKHSKSKIRYAKITKDIPRDFKGEFDKNKKRPNPKARKRLAAQKRAAGTTVTVANNNKIKKQWRSI